MTKDEFMPVLGIGIMTAFLFILLKKFGEEQAIERNKMEIAQES